MFSKIVFLAIGGQTQTRNLQRWLHLELTGRHLTQISHEAYNLGELQKAALGIDMLLLIDGAQDTQQLRLLNCVDPCTKSNVLVATRIWDLVPGAPQLTLELPEAHDAVTLMMKAAGSGAAPPYEAMAYEAVEACGRLPLLLVIAGRLLSSSGGCITQNFLKQFRGEDMGATHHREHFEEHMLVKKDRIIAAALKICEGADNDNVLKLFYSFAMFAEEVPVPFALFVMFATAVFGSEFIGLKAERQVRSWVETLLRLSLLQGSLDKGLYQHHAVRHYVVSHCGSLRHWHRSLTIAILSKRPASGVWPSVQQVTPGSVEHYVAEHAWWHVRGALGAGGDEDDKLVAKLIVSEPPLVEACIIGVGYQAILEPQKQQNELAIGAWPLSFFSQSAHWLNVGDSTPI